jgi:hypothetical protein
MAVWGRLWSIFWGIVKTVVCGIPLSSEAIVAVITAVPLLVFTLKELVATPAASATTVGAVMLPYTGSLTVKVTVADGTTDPEEVFLATTVMTEISLLLATTHALPAAMVDAESAMSAETVPMKRTSTSRINIPAFARISDTLEKYGAWV